MTDLAAILRTELVPRRLAYRPAEAAEAVGLSLETIKSLIRSGELPVCRIGRCNCILTSDLEAMLLSRRTRNGGGA